MIPFLWLGVLGAGLSALDSFLNKSLAKAFFDMVVTLFLALVVASIARRMKRTHGAR